MVKALKKLGVEGSYLSIGKDIYDSPITNIILNEENPNALPLKSELDKGIHYLHSYQYGA
jgi:hypothetical protein